jgi:hypothetical protein
MRRVPAPATLMSVEEMAARRGPLREPPPVYRTGYTAGGHDSARLRLDLCGAVESIAGARERDIPTPAKIRVAEALERIVRLDEAWGRAEKAAAWFRRAAR